MARLTEEDRELILQVLHDVQDADVMLLGLHVGCHQDRISRAMGHHRQAAGKLMQLLGGSDE